jgi:hypothetical protein
MRLSRLAFPLLPVLALGCASLPSAPPPTTWPFASATPDAGKELRMRSQDKYIQISVDGDNIYGPTFSLSHGPKYIRGTGPGRSVIDVQLDGTRAVGNVHNAPFTVDLKPQGDGVTQVTGLFGGVSSDFKISPAIFSGKLGTCSYEFNWTGSRYEGKVSCGGAAQQGSLELPVAMASWTDLEVATVIGIVLGT